MVVSNDGEDADVKGELMSTDQYRICQLFTYALSLNKSVQQTEGLR